MKNSQSLALLVMFLIVAAAESAPPLAASLGSPSASGRRGRLHADIPHDLDDRAGLETFLDGVIRAGMEEHHASGGVVSAVKDGKVPFAKGYGFKDIDKREPVDPRTTLFRIGSTHEAVHLDGGDATRRAGQDRSRCRCEQVSEGHAAARRLRQARDDAGSS